MPVNPRLLPQYARRVTYSMAMVLKWMQMKQRPKSGNPQIDFEIAVRGTLPPNRSLFKNLSVHLKTMPLVVPQINIKKRTELRRRNLTLHTVNATCNKKHLTLVTQFPPNGQNVNKKMIHNSCSEMRAGKQLHNCCQATYRHAKSPENIYTRVHFTHK